MRAREGGREGRREGGRTAEGREGGEMEGGRRLDGGSEGGEGGLGEKRIGAWGREQGRKCMCPVTDVFFETQTSQGQARSRSESMQAAVVYD